MSRKRSEIWGTPTSVPELAVSYSVLLPLIALYPAFE